MKTTLHTRLDKAPSISPDFFALLQEAMRLYSASYRGAFQKVNTLAKECEGNKALLAKRAGEQIYPALKKDPLLQQKMQDLLQAYRTKNPSPKFPEQTALWERLQEHPLLDSWTSEYCNSLMRKALGEYDKFKELTKTQLTFLLQKRTAVMQFIVQKTQDLQELKKEDTSSWSPKKLQKHLQKCNALDLLIANKHKKVQRLSKSIGVLEQRLETKRLSVCFGSKTLLNQNPTHHSRHRKRKGALPRNSTILTGTTSSSAEDISSSSSWEKQNALSPFSTQGDWKVLWKSSRDNLLYAPGDSKALFGNGLIQYDPNAKALRLRLPPLMALKRLIHIGNDQGIALEELLDTKNIKLGGLRKQSQWITLEGVTFSAKHQQMIEYAQSMGQPLTMSIVKKLTPQGAKKLAKGKDKGSITIEESMFGYYLHVTLEEAVAPLVQHKGTRGVCLGVDFNAKGLAYCVVKQDGNKKAMTCIKEHEASEGTGLKPFGFIPWSISEGSAGARSKSLEQAIHQLIDTATRLGVYRIAIENLSFESIKSKMKEGYVAGKQSYHKMLSGLPHAAFLRQMQRQCTRSGVTLLLVNPDMYTNLARFVSCCSVGGFTKYGLLNGLPIDIAAALWIGRQGVLGEKPLLEKIQNQSLEGTLEGVPQMLMVKQHTERTVFPTLPWAHQRNMPKRQILTWNKVLSQLKVHRRLWKAYWRTFILQGQSPLKKGKPPSGGNITSRPEGVWHFPVQSMDSSSHVRRSSNISLPSKNHTI